MFVVRIPEVHVRRRRTMRTADASQRIERPASLRWGWSRQQPERRRRLPDHEAPDASRPPRDRLHRGGARPDPV